MKLAIIGGRDFNDYDYVKRVFDDYFLDKVDTIVSGGATGVDGIALTISKVQDLYYVEYPPDWEQFGRRAGPIRNKQIIDTCDFLLAFWDGESKDTQNSISLAKKMKKPTMIIYY